VVLRRVELHIDGSIVYQRLPHPLEEAFLRRVPDRLGSDPRTLCRDIDALVLHRRDDPLPGHRTHFGLFRGGLLLRHSTREGEKIKTDGWRGRLRPNRLAGSAPLMNPGHRFLRRSNFSHPA